jgi:hypothetical protein
LILAAFFGVLFTVNFAYAQHHSGSAAPPVSFGGKDVTISAALDPADFNPSKDSSAKLNVRFFDSKTNTNIERVTYRVQIFAGETLLAAQMFYDADGELTVKVQPKSECSEKEVWRCTKFEGNKDPIVPSAIESSATSTPVMRGPVFDKPGEYTVKVAIIGATNPKTQTAEDIEFETKINIASEQQFSLATASGKTPVMVRAFQDKITNFEFSESTKTITFEMPFHWEHAKHVSMVRTDVEIPKSFAPFQGVSSFKGTVNGVPIFASGVSLDTYSNKDTNILRFAIVGEELKMIEKKVTDKHTMTVQITPDNTSLKSTDVKFSNGYKATISYDPRYGASKNVSFTMAFFDSSGALAKDIRYALSVKDSKGSEFYVNTGSGGVLGIPLPSGADSKLISIPSKGEYTLQMYLIGRGMIDFDPYVPASIKFNIDEGQAAIPTPEKTDKSDKKDTKKDTKKEVKDTKKKSDKKDTKKDTKKKTKPKTVKSTTTK